MMSSRTTPIISTLLAAALLLSACGGSGGGLRPDSSQGVRTAAEANANLGLGYLRQGNYSEALVKLKRALRQDPKLARAHHYIAELYKRLEQNDLAEQHFRRATELDPNDSAAHNNFGAFLCSGGRFSEAEPHFMAAVGNPLYNGRAESYENAAICALQAGEDAKGERYLSAALKLNPRLPRPLYRMAELSYRQQNYLKARAYLQRFEALARPTAEILWLGFRIEKQAGNESAAAQYASQLEQQHPSYEPWRRYLSDGTL